MNSLFTKTLKLAAVAALAGFALTGCMTSSSSSDPTTDGGNAVMAQETGNMGIVLNESSSMSKIADDTDTITKEKVVVLRHYDDTCQCFIRSTQFLNKKGFERSRLDSIWLDSSGHLLSVYLPGHADSITFIRHLIKIPGYSDKDVDLTIHTTFVKTMVGGSIVFQWNGSVTGTFDGTQFVSKTFSFTITYSPSTGFVSVSGTVDIVRGSYEVIITISGGTATCTVYHSGVLVRTTHVDSDGNEM